MDNSNIKNKNKSKSMVVDYYGNPAQRKECRLIGDTYYKKGDTNVENSGQIYYIEDFKKSNGELGAWIKNVDGAESKIAYSITSGKYMLKENLTKAFNGDTREFCYIEYVDNLDKYDMCLISSSTYPVINTDTMYFDRSRGVWMRSKVNNRPFERTIRKNSSYYRNFSSDNYNIADADSSRALIKQYYKPTISKFANYVSQYTSTTFGIELENTWGRLSETMLFKLGVVPLKDGSVDGIEYASIIHTGKTAIQSILDMKDIGYMTCNKFNSTHFHMYAGDNTPKQLVALYQLYYQVQQEVWNIIPPFKKSFHFAVAKNGQDHCMNLPDLGILDYYNDSENTNKTKTIQKLYDDIFTIFHDGQAPCSQYNPDTKKHFKGKVRKWNYTGRYYNLNFWNVFFGSGTVEFRAVHGTFNWYKVMFYYLICNGIFEFAKNKADYILAEHKIDLEEILKNVYNEELADIILDFILERKRIYRKNRMQQVDCNNNEFDDENYKFSKLDAYINKIENGE